MKQFSLFFKFSSTKLIKEINRDTLPKIMNILKVAQSNKLTMKDEQSLPTELKQHFSNYHDYLEWQTQIGSIFEHQKNIANNFQLDLMVYVQFLILFKKMNNQPLPDETYESLIANMGNQKSLHQLIQLLRLSVRQPQLIKMERKEILRYCINLPESTNNQSTLFHLCLNQISQQVNVSKFTARLEEATAILQALKDTNILTELIKFNPKWFRRLVRVCIKSLPTHDIRNLSFICFVFMDTGDDILLQLCEAFINNSQQPQTCLDVVQILQMLSHVQSKQDEKFIQALQKVLQIPNQQQILKSSKVADQVLSLWALQRIQLDNESLSTYTKTIIQQLFQSLRGTMGRSKSIENQSQFYVASLRLGLIEQAEASIIFDKIINHPDNRTKMAGMVLFETFQRFPELIAKNSTRIVPKLPNIVNHQNIANLYVVFKKEEAAQDLLFERVQQLLPKIHFDGLRIIIDVIRYQSNPERQLQFHLQLLNNMIQKLDDPIEATSTFLRQEQFLASLFITLQLDLVKLEQIDEHKLLPITAILKCLKYYQSTSSSKVNGLGNLLYVCSSLRESKNAPYSNQIQSFYEWMIERAATFDLLELLNLYKAMNDLKIDYSEEVNNRIDESLVQKLVESEHGSEKINQVRQRFLVSFSRFYKQQYQQLVKVHEYISGLEDVQ